MKNKQLNDDFKRRKMRSEQEIVNEINNLRMQEKIAEKEMKESIKDGDCIMTQVHMNKANGIQCQRLALEWVLNK
jgi:hypothetical protein